MVPFVHISVSQNSARGSQYNYRLPLLSQFFFKRVNHHTLMHQVWRVKLNSMLNCECIRRFQNCWRQNKRGLLTLFCPTPLIITFQPNSCTIVSSKGMRTLCGLKDKVLKQKFVLYLTQIVLVQFIESSILVLPRGSYKTRRAVTDSGIFVGD